MTNPLGLSGMLRSVVTATVLSAAISVAVENREWYEKYISVAEKQEQIAVPLPEVPLPDVPKIFPVPTTARCIVIICCQYMIVYTALAACTTYQELRGRTKGNMEAGLRAAAQTLTYGPMLCVLFIACRMRVEFLSDGKDQPQGWVQTCMYALTFAVLASTVLVLLIPIFTGKPLPLRAGSCDLEMPEVDESRGKVAFYVLTGLRYLILLGLYGGLAGVIVGICIYKPPGARDLSELPQPAPAVACTMVLAVTFFSTQLVIAICRTYNEFTGVEFPEVVTIMDAAATTVEFAPMLSILFLAARMRALQHDSQPQSWAQQCMFASTIALCFTTLLAIAVPLVLGGTMKRNDLTKETTFQVPGAALACSLLVIRYMSQVAFYGGTIGVAYSIFVFEAPGGEKHTLPVSTTLQCVVNLACQYFFVYSLMTVLLTVSELSGGAVPMEKSALFAAIVSTKSTVAFAPMLCILFVTTRMYALQITEKRGAPQAWVQDGMCMATWSLMISFLACLSTGLIVDRVETDENGNVMNKFSNRPLTMAMTIVRYLSMLLLHGGIVLVIVGLFVMTPETANGHGAVPYVSGAINSTPFGSAPPGPTSVQYVD